MASEPSHQRQPLADDITDEQIQQLIAEKERNGAENCRVVTEDGQRFLLWTWPAV